MPELRAENVTFAFSGREPLFQHLDFSVRTGELIVLVGENASGKTTLLRLLSGLLTPNEGRVLICDKNEGEPKGRVGVLFQNPDHQMLAASVEEEIALGLELRGMKPELMRPIVDGLLSRFGLMALCESPPEALSGGQKQRVALAAIMALKPPFLLFDEPDSFLDAPSRRDLLSALQEMREDCGIVWVTPFPQHAPRADHYGLLCGARVKECERDDLPDFRGTRAETSACS